MTLTNLLLDDAPDAPAVRMDLPEVRLGDVVNLQLRLTRLKQGRKEVLEVKGDYRVVKRTIDATQGQARQVVTVAASGKAPSWRAVKRDPTPKLAKAVSPRHLLGDGR
jgi:hypothetical protein